MSHDEQREKARAAVAKIEAWARGDSFAPTAAEVALVRQRLETLERVNEAHVEAKHTTRRDLAAHAIAGHIVAWHIAQSYGVFNVDANAGALAAVVYGVADALEKARRA